MADGSTTIISGNILPGSFLSYLASQYSSESSSSSIETSSSSTSSSISGLKNEIIPGNILPSGYLQYLIHLNSNKESEGDGNKNSSSSSSSSSTSTPATITGGKIIEGNILPSAYLAYLINTCSSPSSASHSPSSTSPISSSSSTTSSSSSPSSSDVNSSKSKSPSYDFSPSTSPSTTSTASPTKSPQKTHVPTKNSPLPPLRTGGKEKDSPRQTTSLFGKFPSPRPVYTTSPTGSEVSSTGSPTSARGLMSARLLMYEGPCAPIVSSSFTPPKKKEVLAAAIYHSFFAPEVSRPLANVLHKEGIGPGTGIVDIPSAGGVAVNGQGYVQIAKHLSGRKHTHPLSPKSTSPYPHRYVHGKSATKKKQ